MNEMDVIRQAQEDSQNTATGCALIMCALLVAFAAGFGLALLVTR